MNDKLMHSIGTDRNNNLPEANFVKYFDLSLATDKATFDINVKQFMECAEACRKRKIEKRQAKKVDAGPNPLDKLQKESDMLKRELKATLWLCIFCCCVSFLPLCYSGFICRSVLFCVGVVPLQYYLVAV